MTYVKCLYCGKETDDSNPFGNKIDNCTWCDNLHSKKSTLEKSKTKYIPKKKQEVIQQVNKNIPLLRRLTAQAMIKYSRCRNSKTKKILKNFLKTGTVTKREAREVYQDVRIFIGGHTTGIFGFTVTVSGGLYQMLIGTGFDFQYAISFPIMLVVMMWLTGIPKFLSQFVPRNISKEEIKKWEAEIERGGNKA